MVLRTTEAREDEPPLRAAYHHGDLRNALIEAARALIAASGPEGFTLREVARQIGVNHRAAYRHFEDKRALLAAVAQQGFEALYVDYQRVMDAAQGHSAEQRLKDVLRHYVAFALAHPAEFTVMTGPRLNLDQRFPALEESAQQAFKVVVMLMQKALAVAGVTDVKTTDATVAMLAMVHGLSGLILLQRIHVKPDQLMAFTDRLIDGALHGFLPAKSAR